MENDIFTDIITEKDTLDYRFFESEEEVSSESEIYIIPFICKLESWKTKCKNLHWAAPAFNIHKQLDKFLDILIDIQDSIAEEYMGIFRKIEPSEIVTQHLFIDNAQDFIKTISKDTYEFYHNLGEDDLLAGMRSEVETFIHNINKYNYLFSLCKG